MDLLKTCSWKDLKKGKSCVIVGNSPLITEYEEGQKIKSFDCVVRLNDAPTDNFEKYVGNRTDLRVLNRTLQKEKGVGNLDSDRSGVLEKFESDVLLYPTPFVIEEDAKEKLVNVRNIYRVSNFFRTYKEAIEKELGIKRLSTGLFSTILLVHIFESVALINFDFYNSTSSYHYWEDFDGGDTSPHAFEKEKNFIFYLHEKDKINFIDLNSQGVSNF